MFELTPRYGFVRVPGGMRYLDAPLRETQAAHADRLERVVSDLEEGIHAARNDVKLTQEGAHERGRELATTAHGFVLAADRFWTADLRRQEDAGGAAMLSPQSRHALPPNADPDQWRDAEREVRERLYRMEEQEVEAVYVAACKRADRQTVRAIELAPQAFPLISESAKERGRELFAEAAYPDRWPLYMELQGTRAALELNQQAAIQWIERIAAVRVGPDPLEELMQKARDAAA